jgi:hypothetical protein
MTAPRPLRVIIRFEAGLWYQMAASVMSTSATIFLAEV